MVAKAWVNQLEWMLAHGELGLMTTASSSLADEMPTANFSHVQPTSDILLKILTGTPLSLHMDARSVMLSC